MVWLQILNIVALICTLVVNALAVTLPLNGKSTGELSDNIPVLFTPSGYVFSIWSLIYLGLIVFAIYQILPARRDGELVNRIGWWFIASCVFNCAWIFLWHYERVILSVPVMLGILVSLIMVYLRLGIGVRTAPTGEKLLVHLPFSIYLGWISVATVANVSAALYVVNWNGFGLSEEVWTIVMLVVGAALGILMILRRGEVAYPLVIVWAFLGILVRHIARPVLAAPAGIMVVVLLAVMGMQVARGQPSV